jgi:hypothetical protein
LQGSDGCFVAAFSVRGACRENIEEVAWEGSSELGARVRRYKPQLGDHLLTYGTARILLADDGGAKEEDSYSPKCVVEDFSYLRLQTSS